MTPRGRFKSNAEKTLRVRLEEVGIDYHYFLELDVPKATNTAIADILSKKYKRVPPFHRTTIGGYRKLRQEEAES